jgi:hypothetical protein
VQQEAKATKIQSDNEPGRDGRLLLAALLTLGGYLILAFWFPLFPYFNRSPLVDINSFIPSVSAALAYILLFAALYFLYWFMCQVVKRRKKEMSLSLILISGLIFALPLLAAYPVNANDIYRYFIRGRISTIHNESPYLVSPAELGEAEPYTVLAGEWADKTSPYGPVWELFAAVLATLAPDNLWLALLLFKGLAVLCHLAVGGLIWWSLKGKSAALRSSRTALWVWNPALLLIFAVDGHNDSLMLVWLMLGWWLMSRERFQWAMVVLILAPLSKPIGLLALPIFFLAALRRMDQFQARLRFFLVTAVSWVLLVLLFFLPFGPPLSLAQRLLVEAGSGGEFSFLALFFLIARDVFGAAITAASIETATRFAVLLFLILALWLMWRSWHGRSALRGTADIFLGYVVQSFVFRIWYTAWTFPWLLLDSSDSPETAGFFSLKRLKTAEGRLSAGFWFLFTTEVSVMIYGQLRSSLLDGQHLYAHLIGVPFTFLLPLIVAGISLRKSD